MSQITNSNELHVDEIKSKTKKGLVSLFSRSLLTYLLRGLSIFLLARFLSPQDYGVFGILNSWVWGINLILPDLSMFTALIQQKAEPSKEQMQNLFGCSLYRGFTIILIIFLFGNFIIKYHNLNDESYIMLLSLGLFIFFDCLKTPLRMMIERNLDFSKVVTVEISETIVMYTVQIFSAWKGLGAWSFIIAILARSIWGLLFYLYYEKKIYLPIISIVEIKKLFHFEFMVQFKTIIIGIKGMVIPIVLGRILSTNDLGIVMWTISIASIPVVLIHNYDRVLFPALSRLHSNLQEFKKVASKGIELNIAAMGLIFGAIAISTSPAISFFFPEKWSAAKIILPISCLAIFLSQVRYLGSSILNASARPKTLLKIEAFAIILEFVFAIPAVYYYQSTGYFYALIVLECIICIVMFLSNNNYLNPSTPKRLITVLASSLIGYFLINKFIINFMSSNILELVTAIILYCLCYLFLLVVIDNKFKDELQFIIRDINRKYISRNAV